MIDLVDLGSNTIRLGRYSFDENGIIYKLSENVVYCTLADYIENGEMNQVGINKLIETLKNILKGVDNAKIIATASLRKCKNKDLILNLCSSYGFEIEIISGEEESQLSFLGATLDISKTNYNDGMFLDIGGGSSEIVFFSDNQIKKCFSIDIGSMSLYKDYIQKNIKLDSVVKKISAYDYTFDAKICFLSGGTGETFKIIYEKLGNDKNVFFIDDIDFVINNFDKVKSFVEEINEKRVLTIIPGLFILRCILNASNIDKFILTRFGIREGFILKNKK